MNSLIKSRVLSGRRWVEFPRWQVRASSRTYPFRSDAYSGPLPLQSPWQCSPALPAWIPRGTAGALDNPFANAQFTRLTDFEGAELDAAISPDSKFVAFLSDRDGPFGVWLTQVSTGNSVKSYVRESS